MFLKLSIFDQLTSSIGIKKTLKTCTVNLPCFIILFPVFNMFSWFLYVFSSFCPFVPHQATPVPKAPPAPRAPPAAWSGAPWATRGTRGPTAPRALRGPRVHLEHGETRQSVGWSMLNKSTAFFELNMIKVRRMNMWCSFLKHLPDWWRFWVGSKEAKRWRDPHGKIRRHHHQQTCFRNKSGLQNAPTLVLALTFTFKSLVWEPVIHPGLRVCLFYFRWINFWEISYITCWMTCWNVRIGTSKHIALIWLCRMTFGTNHGLLASQNLS